jgi:hypothetical protein
VPVALDHSKTCFVIRPARTGKDIFTGDIGQEMFEYLQLAFELSWTALALEMGAVSARGS